ncbi:MAG: prepilin-type N-terminal cleavage/methylation domain-containing protein [Chlamydiales bacterium]
MRDPSKPRASRSGMTLVEIMISVTILSLVGMSLQTIVNVLGNSYTSGIRRIALDTSGARTMLELIGALRMSERSSLSALPAAPFSATSVTFRRTDRVVDGLTEWIDPERIVYDPAIGEVHWIEYPGLPEELVTHRCRGIAPMLEGEIANGVDDNGNGLIDEPGFCLDLEDDVLTARFTLQGTDAQGRLTQRTWTRSIECRN